MPLLSVMLQRHGSISRKLAASRPSYDRDRAAFIDSREVIAREIEGLLLDDQRGGFRDGKLSENAQGGWHDWLRLDGLHGGSVTRAEEMKDEDGR